MGLHLRTVILVQILIDFHTCEWVQVSFSSSEIKNVSELHGEEPMTPSPAWVEYQKERFQGTNMAQRLMVSGENPLNTSAEIIVAAKPPDTKTKQNKILHVKTKISVNSEENYSIHNKSAKGLPKPKPTGNSFFGTDLKFPSFLKFLHFITSLQRRLLPKTSFGITDKIKALKNLRNQLMLDIEDRFFSIFPRSRQRRGLVDESNFHFPPEAALMSISFLTFSVFLIKLVLQVIHIIKSKHYSYPGMTNNNMNMMNARRFGGTSEDLETLKKVTEAIKIKTFHVK